MPSMTGGDQLGEDYAPWAHEPNRLTPQAMDALRYIQNAGDGATVEAFLDDHEPIGQSLLGEILVRCARLAGTRLSLTDEGRLAIAPHNEISPENAEAMVIQNLDPDELRARRGALEEERDGVKRFIRRDVEAYEAKLREAHAGRLRGIAEAIALVNAAIETIEVDLEAKKVAEVAKTDPRVGKMYRMWKRKYKIGRDEWMPTATMGRVMVLTSAMLRACKPRGSYWFEAGDVVIRQLKKDGTPSAYFYDIHSGVWREEPENEAG